MGPFLPADRPGSGGLNGRGGFTASNGTAEPSRGPRADVESAEGFLDPGTSYLNTTVPSLARIIRGDTLCLAEMATGTVDFFNDTGGYGFIDTEDADEDVFFHMEDIGGPDLEEGQEVEFEVVEAEKGPRAKNLTRL